MSLTLSLTQVVGPAVPGLVLVGEAGVEGGSAILFKFVFDVLSHVFSSAGTEARPREMEEWTLSQGYRGLMKD